MLNTIVHLLRDRDHDKAFFSGAVAAFRIGHRWSGAQSQRGRSCFLDANNYNHRRDNKRDRMGSSDIGPKGEERRLADDTESLNTDARVLAYLRAAMLESGDDPNVMAMAMKVAEAARAKLQRNGPLRVTSDVLELSRLAAKRLA
jgi:hypothetical protein